VTVTKQLKDVRKQLDLDKRVAGVADKVGLAERKKVLGIPVSRKRPDWGRIATYGAAATAVAIAGVRAVSGNGAGTSDDDASDAGEGTEQD
jgi:hypothetical protein